MRTMFSGIKDLRAKAEEYRELDDDRVLTLTYLTGRGKTSGIPVGQRGAEVFQIREGKVTRVDVWFDRSRALVDLSLAPETGASPLSRGTGGRPRAWLRDARARRSD